MAISMADIEALVAQFEASDWRRIELIADGVELRLSKDGAVESVAGPVAVPAAVPGPAVAPAVVASSGQQVAAPSLGTFYRAPKPGEAPFVSVGSRVAAGDPLCLVEVMKLFTTVNAPIGGTVVAIHAVDGDLVEFGQPLLSIDPDG
ncbi:MAG: acetyl-CoA carboxylase biotin carboxyl carrier protein [Sandaracinobacter sp.]